MSTPNDMRQLLHEFMLSLCELQDEIERRKRAKQKAPVECYSDKCSFEEPSDVPMLEPLEEYVISYIELEETARALVEAALTARLNAYVPYTNFRVGAAFRTRCDEIYAGCNVENAAHTPGCCAERSALVKAVSEGHQEFKEGAVVAYNPAGGYTTPCGVCRQFMMEFAKSDIPIYIAKAPEVDDTLPLIADDDEILVTSIYNMLPHSFNTFGACP